MATSLIIGATRGTGLLIAKKLLQQNTHVRIIARNAEKAKRLFAGTKAEIIISDLRTPNQAFYKAFENTEHIFFTAAVPMGYAKEELIKQVDYQGVVYALEAAKKTNFKGRFYYMNTIGCYHHSFFMSFLNLIKKNLSNWRIEAEKAIQSSGLCYTIIRAGILTNSSSGSKKIKISREDIPITFTTTISRNNVADIFIACMHETSTLNKELSVIWGKTNASVKEQLEKL